MERGGAIFDTLIHYGSPVIVKVASNLRNVVRVERASVFYRWEIRASCRWRCAECFVEKLWRKCWTKEVMNSPAGISVTHLRQCKWILRYYWIESNFNISLNFFTRSSSDSCRVSSFLVNFLVVSEDDEYWTSNSEYWILTEVWGRKTKEIGFRRLVRVCHASYFCF